MFETFCEKKACYFICKKLKIKDINVAKKRAVRILLGVRVKTGRVEHQYMLQSHDRVIFHSSKVVFYG